MLSRVYTVDCIKCVSDLFITTPLQFITALSLVCEANPQGQHSSIQQQRQLAEMSTLKEDLRIQYTKDRGKSGRGKQQACGTWEIKA